MKTIIVGAGAAGLAAAVNAAKNGADVLLVESESTVGGDLFSGMPILGAYTSRGECCVHGVLDEIVDVCEKIDPDSCIGPVCDWRTVYGLCLDPEILRLAVLELLRKYGVELILNSTVVGVDVESGGVKKLRVAGRNRSFNIDCACVVDATGGGNVTSMAGGEVENGDEEGRFQPISLLFRMVDVQFEPLLRFIRDNPGEALLSENPVMEKNAAEAAIALYEHGLPYVAIAASGKLLGGAIEAGEIHPCTAAFITPTSMRRGEVCLNSTRVSGVDCTNDLAVSAALLELSAQAANLAVFFRKRVPGFGDSSISSIANRIGVRETGRIKGEHTLSQSEVVEAARHSDCVAKGAHHVDIHGAGTAQIRIPVRGGGSYDIPYGCLIPKGLKNILAAGRCLSSDRGANGSARVMGTCIATGQAAGAAAAIYANRGLADTRSVSPKEICFTS